MPLEDEISARSQQISSDAYAMSVGELINLYKDKELNLHPEFQRFFRWREEQKSRLIESILLQIPIPPIFVAQDKAGKWDVVDGLQRLSTILALTGDLKNEEGETVDPLVLKRTKYLPSLEGKKWACEDPNDPNQLPEPAKLAIKRARLDIKIVLNKSDPSAKYELFDRLNTGGSAATDQEVRNCILLMLNKPFFKWMSELADDENFKECLPLSERQIEEQYGLELVVRFLTLTEASPQEVSSMVDLGPFLTEKISQFAQDDKYDQDRMGKAFHAVFAHLAETLGEDSFKKFSPKKGRASGPVLISLYEVFALGLGYNFLQNQNPLPSKTTLQIHQTISDDPRFSKGTGSGVRPTSRLPVTIPLGRELFA